MAATAPPYPRPESFRGQQCAEAPAGRRRSTCSGPSRRWPGPSVAAWCASEPVLLSCPGLLLAQTASARRAFRRHPSGRASSPWSTLPGHQPWCQWTVGVHRGVSTHPDVVVRGPAVQSVRCPVTWSRPGSGRLLSTPSSVQPSAVRPRPSGRVRLVPRQVVALAARPVRRATVTTGSGRGPCGRPRRRAARSTAEQPWGRRCRGRALDSRDVGGRPGPGWVRAAARTRRATRRARPACRAPVAGGARWPRLPHSCRPVLGGRPLWVVVVAPAAYVDGPGGADGRAGRGGRAAPARPRLATSVPGLLPTAL
jgi:hypothetical protein